MKRDFQRRKALVRWGLGVVLLLDLLLAGVNWRIEQSPHISVGELKRLDLLEKSYRADNTRLNRFRSELPADEKQWDDFFTTHFRPAGAGYSAISADLDEISRSAGLRADKVTFTQHNADARGLMQVDISTAVEGDYESLINFLNRLGHSDNFYVLDSMELASSSGGKLRLNLQLRTYFRT
jgi:Tfp pilus assembly protein PilO